MFKSCEISLWISKCWWLESCQISIWRFPKIGVPPVIIHSNGIFLDKPSSYGGIPISKDPHISMWPQHPFGTSSGVRTTASRVTIATIAGKTSCSAARWARGPWGGQRVGELLWDDEMTMGILEEYKCWLVVWNINFIFPYIGNNHPNWLIFFRGVQTTNQSGFIDVPNSHWLVD